MVKRKQDAEDAPEAKRRASVVRQSTLPFPCTEASDERKTETVSSIPGLVILHNAVTQKEEEALLQEIDARKWNTALARRTQHYAFEYDYRNPHTIRPSALSIDGALAILRDRIEEELSEFGVTKASLNQIIVNEYRSTQGIGAHTDSHVFGPFIVGVNLGSPVGMEFSRADERVNIWLPSRSYYLMSGDARNKWTHAIPATRIAIGPDERPVYRSCDFRRVSITLRNVPV